MPYPVPVPAGSLSPVFRRVFLLSIVSALVAGSFAPGALADSWEDMYQPWDSSSGSAAKPPRPKPRTVSRDVDYQPSGNPVTTSYSMAAVAPAPVSSVAERKVEAERKARAARRARERARAARERRRDAFVPFKTPKPSGAGPGMSGTTLAGIAAAVMAMALAALAMTPRRRSGL